MAEGEGEPGGGPECHQRQRSDRQFGHAAHRIGGTIIAENARPSPRVGSRKTRIMSNARIRSCDWRIEWQCPLHFVGECSQIQLPDTTRSPARRWIGRGTPDTISALPVHPWSKQHGYLRSRLSGAQIFCSRLAAALVGNDIEADLLPFIEGAHAGAFDRADMNENVSAAAGELDEA